MAKGGARAHSGPPPDPNALRRERDGDSWVPLDPAGRQGPAPAWPLEHQSERESELWAEEWKRPQAVMWEHNGQEVEVALYVRSVVAAEQVDAPTNARTLVRQQQEALGISVPGMLRNKWRIADEPTPGQGAKPVKASAKRARQRFKVIDGGSDT